MAVKATLKLFYPTELNYNNMMSDKEAIFQALVGLLELNKEHNLLNYYFVKYEAGNWYNYDNGFTYYFKERKDCENES